MTTGPGEPPEAGSTATEKTEKGNGFRDSAEYLRADIALTRQELGDTVEALVEKINVKARVRQKGAEARQRVHDVGARARQGWDGLLDRVPEQVRRPVVDVVDRIVTVVRDRPAPAAAVIGVLGSLLVIRWIRNRRKR
ncbi:MAG TPA: DUF3618 domain-containing protein [Pseudonocardiaceae bacterium]